MTAVVIDLREPAGDGEDVPIPARLEFKPSRRRNVDDYVVLPDPFTATFTSAPLTVTLAATTDGVWAWEVTERGPKGGKRRWLAVPESATPVLYGDLVEVERSSLEPDATPPYAWDLALAALAATVATPLTESSDHPGLYS